MWKVKEIQGSGEKQRDVTVQFMANLFITAYINALFYHKCTHWFEFFTTDIGQCDKINCTALCVSLRPPLCLVFLRFS